MDVQIQAPKVSSKIVFFIALSILCFFSTVTLNTGDGGELITASYGLGVAHSPGYPLYLILAKFFSFIPFGNIAERIAFFSVCCGAICVVLVFEITFLFTNNVPASFGASLTLLFSYSFFNQCLICKFYPLNLLLVLILFFVGIQVLTNGYHTRYVFFVSLLFALGMANHHTLAFMIIPYSFLVLLYIREVYKLLPLALIFGLLLLLMIYIYVFIRSQHPNLEVFLTIKNFHDLLELFFRKNYGGGSSLAVVAAFNPFKTFIPSAVNVFSLVEKEFLGFSLPMAIIGLIWILKKDKKVSIFYVLSFCAYSFMEAMFVFSVENRDIKTYYIVAHQYFLPLFAFYSIALGCGLAQFISWLKLNRYSLVAYSLGFLPFFILPFRCIDSNYQNHYILYYSGIDSLFVQSLNSIYWASGDNIINRTLYLKNIEHFREDICALAPPMASDLSMRNLCPIEKYHYIHNDLEVVFDKKKKIYIIHLPTKSSYYSNIEQVNILKQKGIFAVLDYEMLPLREFDKLKGKLEPKHKKERLLYLPYIDFHKNWCFWDTTDDWFSSIACGSYVPYYAYLSRDLGKKGKTLFKFYLGEKKLSFYINKQNKDYVEALLELNKITAMGFYLSPSQNLAKQRIISDKGNSHVED